MENFKIREDDRYTTFQIKKIEFYNKWILFKKNKKAKKQIRELLKKMLKKERRPRLNWFWNKKSKGAVIVPFPKKKFS